MGGTWFERLVQYVRDWGPELPDRPYTCLECECLFDVQYHVCPECGGFRVEIRDKFTRYGSGVGV
jgi:rRNA maturation endonuclease Nob1